METEKQALRREIAREKKTYAEAQLGAWSDEICRAVEKREAFRRARCVACYHALPGEVQTEAFLNRWCGAKRMLLPRVEGDDLRLYPYTGRSRCGAARMAFGNPWRRRLRFRSRLWTW